QQIKIENNIYNKVISRMYTFPHKLTNIYMSVSLKHYMTYIILAIVIGTSTIMFLTNGFSINFSDLADITIIEMVVVLVILIGAVATIFANNNLAIILITGIVGYGVSILFVIYRAPGLALTQLVIETVSVALFLLCFYHLPLLRS